MSDISDHLRVAEEELEEAHQEANIGTALMVQDILHSVRNLRQRYENINDDGDDTE